MHSFICNRVHVVFCTKDRRRAIPPHLQNRLWGYFGALGTAKEITVLEVNGVDDHVHLLIGLPAKLSVAEAVSKLKSNSSRWLSEQLRGEFGWQRGYGAFSVSQSQVPVVRRYIQNQVEHHRKFDFTQEFAALLSKHGIRFESGALAGSSE